MLLSPSFQTMHIVPPLLPALLGGSFVPYLPPDLLQSSLFQLVKTETRERGNDAAWMLERFRPWRHPLTFKLKPVPWTEAVYWVTSCLL